MQPHSTSSCAARRPLRRTPSPPTHPPPAPGQASSSRHEAARRSRSSSRCAHDPLQPRCESHFPNKSSSHTPPYSPTLPHPLHASTPAIHILCPVLNFYPLPSPHLFTSDPQFLSLFPRLHGNPQPTPPPPPPPLTPPPNLTDQSLPLPHRP